MMLQTGSSYEWLKQHNHVLKFKPKLSENSNKNRKRNILWFNPPFSKNVKTNVAKKFLKLIDKHFPPNSKLHKLFNRNNVKVSYCCMPNMESIISQHNKKILKDKSEDSDRKCNCRSKSLCPMNGSCLAKDVIYKAEIVTNDDKKYYIGSCSTTFKLRFANHKQSFIKTEKKNDTELANYIWNLKNSGKNYNISWKILTKAKSYHNGSKNCRF